MKSIKKKRGRKPADWMYELINLSTNEEHVTLENLSERLKVSVPAIRSFCQRQKIEGFYIVKKDRGITEKAFLINVLIKAADTYIKKFDL